MPSLPPHEPVILVDPHPRRIGRIFDEPTKLRLEKIARVIWHDGAPAAAEHIDRYLPQTVALIGQSPLDKARLDRAPHLRAVFNVESNFLLNIDYAECQRRSIPVLSTAPVYARPVAELALLRPFSQEILIHDPWVDPAVLRAADAIPASLDECFARARVVFILAANTSENTGRIGARQFATMQPGSVVVLGSRAALVNFPDLLAAARSGQIRAGIDVWPEEPIPADEPGRTTPNTLLAAHRLGSVPEIQTLIGQFVADDLEAILAGRAPQRCQQANVATVHKLRSIPVGAWSLGGSPREP